MKKKIVHLVYSMSCGGLEKVIVNLVNGSHNELEHVIITLVPEYEMISGINVEIDVFCLNKRPGKDMGCHFRLYKLLKNISPNIINTYNFGTIEYHATAFLAGVKKRVHSDHGHGGDAQDGLNKKNNTIRKFSSYFINDYIVVSQDLKEWVVNIVKVNPNKVHLIQNGVQVSQKLDSPEQSISALPTVCTVGRLDPVKNQTLLVKAFKRLIEQVPFDVRLKIVGEGPERSKLEALTNELKIRDLVEFMGYRDDVRNQLELSNVFVLSSHYEAMPMTILEAMAVGIPVVTTDVGGIKHFIDDRYAYFTKANSEEELANAIGMALIKSQETESMIIEAHNLVRQQYSIETMVSRYIAIYSSKN